MRKGAFWFAFSKLKKRGDKEGMLSISLKRGKKTEKFIYPLTLEYIILKNLPYW